MNAVAAGTPGQKWTWKRWTMIIAVVFVAHVALIFIFGARKQVSPLPVKDASSLTLAGGLPDGLLALNDATLFALPDGNGFAGPMWLGLSLSPNFEKQNWNEEPRWLAAADPLPMSELGAGFNRLMQTNRFANFHLAFNLPPPLPVEAMPEQLPLATHSTLQIQGELAKRALLNPMKLPLWPDADVIAPSVVQVLVDAAGDVLSAVLLPPENFSELSSDSVTRDSAADRYAIQLARAVHFAPLTPNAAEGGPLGSIPGRRLAVGRLIFNWQTTPVTSTNANQ